METRPRRASQCPPPPPPPFVVSESERTTSRATCRSPSARASRCAWRRSACRSCRMNSPRCAPRTRACKRKTARCAARATSKRRRSPCCAARWRRYVPSSCRGGAWTLPWRRKRIRRRAMPRRARRAGRFGPSGCDGARQRAQSPIAHLFLGHARVAATAGVHGARARAWRGRQAPRGEHRACELVESGAGQARIGAVGGAHQRAAGARGVRLTRADQDDGLPARDSGCRRLRVWTARGVVRL